MHSLTLRGSPLQMHAQVVLRELMQKKLAKKPEILEQRTCGGRSL